MNIQTSLCVNGCPACDPGDLIRPCLSTYLPKYKRKGNYLHDHTVIVLHPTTQKFNYLTVNSSTGEESWLGPHLFLLWCFISFTARRGQLHFHVLCAEIRGPTCNSDS